MTNVIEFAAEAIIEYLLVGSVTAFVLVPLGWLIIRAGRIRAPVYRQLFWLYCLVGIALLPVLWLYGPKLTLAVLPAEAESVEVISAPATESGYDAVLFEEAVVETFPLPQATHMQVPSAAHSNTSSFPARTVLALLWLVGFALMLARLTVGWYRLHRICLTAMPVTDRSFFSDGDGRRPKVLLTSQVAGPVCFGLFRPVVMLPPQTYEASAAGELRMVLNHELAHIERGDCWANLFQRIVEAVFFFHPLVWWASLRLTQQREQICDNYVLARGASADEYSTLLARVVQRGPGKAQLPTMALFEGRLLQRVRFLLDPGRDSKTRLSIWAVLVCTIGLLSCLALLGAVRLEARSGADGSDTDGLWEGHSDGGAYQWSWLDPHEDESEVTWTAEKAFETAAKYDSGDGGERPRQRKALRLYQRVLDANPSRLLELRAKARMGIRMTQGYDSELGENSLDAEAVRWYEQMLQDFKDWGAHQHLLEARVRLGDVYFMGPYGQSGVEKAMDLYWEVINVPEEQVVFDEPRSAYLNLENIAKAKAKGRFVGFVGSDGKLMEPPESANRIYRQRLLKQRKSFIDGIRRSAIWAITNKLGDKRLGPPGKKLDRLLELKRKRPDDKYFQQILDGVIGGVKYTSLQQPEWLRYDRPYHSGARIRIDNRWPRGRVIDGAAKKYGVSGPVYVFDPCDPKLHKSMGIAASCEMLRIFSFDFINDKGRPRLDVAFQFQDGKVMGGALFEVDLLDKDMNLLGTQRTLELRNRQMPVERHGGTTEIGGDDPPNRSGKAEMRFDKVPIAEVYAYRLTVLEPDLPLLLELLDEENVYLRESAIKALEPMGPDARAIVPRLLKTSQDEREHVRNPDVRVIHFP
ncbi:MAG: M56 family metallopeptidase, partial [Planctomycetota bacterium]